jgi:hypothetical protein
MGYSDLVGNHRGSAFGALALGLSRISRFVRAYSPSAHMRCDFFHCAFVPGQTQHSLAVGV